VFEAVVQSVQLLNREALTITQRNVNRSFSLWKRLTTIRNFGTLLDLEVAYWPDRFFALTGQIEELSKLSAKALLDTLDAMTVGAPVAQITARESGPRH
jgi:Phasin protein